MIVRRTAILAVFLGLVAARTSAGFAQTTNPPATTQQPKAPARTARTQPIPAAAANPTTGWDERVLKVPVVGQAAAYIPKHPTTPNVVVFISGDGGWNLGVVDMARRVMPKAIVIGVSYVTMRRNAPPTSCWMPSGDLEVIAQDAEKQLKLPEYQPPVLIGYSSGATMVYDALATSPFSFAGGLSMGFCPDMPANHAVCAADTFKPGPHDAKKNIVMLPKVAKLEREWYVLNGIEDQVCLPSEMHTFLAGIGNTHFVEAGGTGHGFSRPGRWGSDFDESLDALLASATVVNHPKAQPTEATGLASTLQPELAGLNLPLEYDWAARSRAMMVFASGDGGWASIDRHVADYLVAHDISVVGLNTQSYFWNARTPAEAGADLARIVGVVAQARLPIFAGGYSLGAEVTPFMVDAWPPADRARIRGEALIAPSETASFEFHVINMVFRAKETPYVVADAVKRSGVPTLCIAGQAEAPRDTACDDLGTAGEAVRLPGSHHFNSKYDDVGAAVLAFIDKHLGPEDRAAEDVPPSLPAGALPSSGSHASLPWAAIAAGAAGMLALAGVAMVVQRPSARR